MEVIKTFTALPKESQNFIIDTLKADYAAGQLPDAERVKQRAAELATQSGYLWIPSGDWVYKFRRETLKVPKRPYGGRGYGPEVDSIMAFIREQMGHYSEDTVQGYRTLVSRFVARGLTSSSAIEEARPSVVTGSDWRRISATLAHMSRYYQRLAESGTGEAKRPCVTRGGGHSIIQSPVGVMAVEEGMEVEAAAAPDSADMALQQVSVPPLLATSSSCGMAAGAGGGDEGVGRDRLPLPAPAHTPTASADVPRRVDQMLGLTGQPLVLSCTGRAGSSRRNNKTTTTSSSSSTASNSSSASSAAPRRLTKSSLKSTLKKELQHLCRERGLAFTDKDLKEALIAKLLAHEQQQASSSKPAGQPDAAPGGGGPGVNSVFFWQRPKEERAAVLGFKSAQQMDAVEGAIRAVSVHCQVDQLTFVAGVGCYNSDVTDQKGALPHGYYCDVTPGRDGFREQLRLVGVQRDNAEHTQQHYKVRETTEAFRQVVLSLLKAAQPVFVRYGIRPRPGYDLFDQDQLIWLVALTSSAVKLGTSATAVSFLALFSRFMDCRMRPGTVVTGELSLAGRMLRIDSLNAKLEGCRSWGVKRVVVPKANWARVAAVFKEDPDFEVLAADDVIELLNHCLEEGQALPVPAAYEAIRRLVPVGMHVRRQHVIDHVEVAAFPGTGSLLITGIEPQDIPDIPVWPLPAGVKLPDYTRPRCDRVQSVTEVALLWLRRVQGEAWFDALPKGRRRFDARRMVLWQDTTATPDGEEDDDYFFTAAGQQEAANAHGDGERAAQAGSEAGQGQAEASHDTGPHSTSTTAAASSGGPHQQQQQQQASGRTHHTGGQQGKSSREEVKADLHIHFPECNESAQMGMTVALALTQLIRGRLTPTQVSAMGELSVCGRLLPADCLAEELIQKVVRKVITVQYKGDGGFSTPKVPEGVRVVGVSNMIQALQAAYQDECCRDEKEGSEEEDGEEGSGNYDDRGTESELLDSEGIEECKGQQA